MKFTCTNCNYSRAVSSNYAGKKVTCPKCKTQIRIPADLEVPVPLNRLAKNKYSQSLGKKQQSNFVRLAAVAIVSILITSALWGSAWYYSTPRKNPSQLSSQLSIRNSATAEQAAPTSSPAKKDALAVLKRMQSYTEVGINYREYSSKLLDVKADFDSHIEMVNDSTFKNKAKNIMAIYKDANGYWGEAIKYSDTKYASLDHKYPFEADYEIFHGLQYKEYSTSHLSTIWACATSELAELEALE